VTARLKTGGDHQVYTRRFEGCCLIRVVAAPAVIIPFLRHCSSISAEGIPNTKLKIGGRTSRMAWTWSFETEQGFCRLLRISHSQLFEIGTQQGFRLFNCSSVIPSSAHRR